MRTRPHRLWFAIGVLAFCLLAIAIAVAASRKTRANRDPVPRWLEEFARVGADRTWDTLTYSEDWQPLLEQIRRGDERAVNLGLQLCAVADTYPGEELMSALGDALKAQPRMILERGRRCTASLRELCTWESAESGPTERKQRRASVLSVQDASLVEEREECLQDLGGTSDGLYPR